MGKLAMGLNPLSKYFGENAVTPSEGELCYDDVTKDIYVWHYDEENEKWIYSSRTKEIQDFLDNMESSGVFQSSAAFVQNRKIRRFYFDLENGVCRIDPDLTFDPIYKYYAIRSLDVDENGAYSYITGVSGTTSENGDVTSSLVNMTLKDSNTADGTLVSVPEPGGLVSECVDGNTYIIEFYDANRKLINFNSYVAVKVRTADTELAPDTAVVDMMVRCNQQNSDGSLFLYQGQDVDALQIDTILKYADERTRDVSNEEINGGKLVIEGLDELDNSTVTGDGDPQEITVVYQMDRTNASYKSSSSYETDIEQSGNNAIVSPASNTIRRTLQVYVVSDLGQQLETIIPVAYVVTDLALGQRKIKLKFFGHYQNGVVHDITNVARISGTQFNELELDQTQSGIIVQFPNGNALGYMSIQIAIVPPGRSNTDINRCKINQNAYRFLEYDEAQTSGGQYSGKFTAFKVETSQGQATVEAANLLNLDGVAYGTKKPTMVRIRDAEDPSYYYTDIGNPETGLYYKVTGDHELRRDKPLLVEFFNLTTDANTGTAVETFITGALVHFAVPVSS